VESRLLEPLDQAVFASLSEFAGPARLEAVAHTAGLDEVVALDSLTRLIDASLVRLQDSPEPRSWMLEPVRQFAAERLELGGDRAAVRCRMLEWYDRATAAFEGDDERFARSFAANGRTSFVLCATRSRRSNGHRGRPRIHRGGRRLQRGR
jgi:hypothetical protein